MTAPEALPRDALPALSFGQRFVLVWSWFFRGLTDGRLAARLRDAQLEFDRREGRRSELEGAPERPSLPPATDAGKATGTQGATPVESSAERTAEARRSAALALLGLLQKEGRLIDFVQQDITAFSDADIGAAARVVHAGCRKALGEHVRIRPVVDQAEGSRFVVEPGFDPVAYKLTGNVRGQAPYSGILRHKGWRAETMELPEPVAGVDGSVLMPAEVEV